MRWTLLLLTASANAIALQSRENLTSFEDDLTSNAPDNSSLSLTDRFGIRCLDATTAQYEVDRTLCSAALAELYNFPAFNNKQEFLDGGPYSSPRRPHWPPYNIAPPGSHCEIEIRSIKQGEPAWFKFREAWELAKSILQHCTDSADGLGGFALIGKDRQGRPTTNWSVMVKGIQPSTGEVASANQSDVFQR